MTFSAKDRVADRFATMDNLFFGKARWYDETQLAKENSILSEQLAMMRDFNKGLERNPAELGLSNEEWANRVRKEAKGL